MSVIHAGLSIEFKVSGENYKVGGERMRTAQMFTTGGRLRAPEALE